MAQNAKISSLTDELIHCILGFDAAANKQAYKRAKDIASRGLRGHQYARTNQFDVTATFAGLDEKFRVKSRDDLADALQTRLQKLDGLADKFKPDVLSLLLLLSDRPLENTRVEALEILRPPSPPPTLTWDDILQDDPYSDEDIWKDIDYAVESSGDEQPKKRGKAKSSPPTSVEEDDTYDPEASVAPVEADLVPELEASQFWNTTSDDNAKLPITELQVIRETLFMLAGLQTSLYHLETQQSNIRIDTRYAVTHAMPDTVEHLLSEVVAIGRDIYRLRQWTKRTSTLPLVQTFEAAVRTRLVAYDQTLAQLQQRYLTPKPPIAVSLLQLHSDVRVISTPLRRLAQLVTNIEPELLVNPFTHLKALFDQVTLAQMTLETETFQYLSNVFFDCLQTYLKPMRKWMEHGELGANDETFFVFETDSGSDANSLWHDRYVLRRDAQNHLRSPSFLQPAVKKIFNTGKSIVFLKELGLRGVEPDRNENEPRLDHATVCGISDEVPLSPFPELFQAAFDGWMQSKYSQASSVLRQHLVESGGLMRTLIILETLYLGRNGAVFEDFANALFERMDAGRRGWNDRYVLTELTRGIFGTVIPHSDAEKIVARSSKAKSEKQPLKNLTTVSLDFAISWSIQNIIQRSSIPIYQQILTFLLQAYRAKYLLQRTRPPRISHYKKPINQLTQKLRHRLTWFADTLRSYLTETAIFFTTQDMDASMEKTEDIDEMAHVHLKYIAKLQERCMLSEDVKPIHQAIMEMLDLAVQFANIVASNDPTSAVRAKVPRRKSTVAATNMDSDTDTDAEHAGSPSVPKPNSQRKPNSSLQKIDDDFARLLHFITAGLRSVGRVGAEPMWEQLAERLSWEGKKDRI
jgi:gamma-tubulin complex component 5